MLLTVLLLRVVTQTSKNSEIKTNFMLKQENVYKNRKNLIKEVVVASFSYNTIQFVLN